MTLITRWEPFREFSVLQDRMNRLFQSNLAAGRDEGWPRTLDLRRQ